MVHTSEISVVKRKKKINDLARDIRKKYLALKLGKSEEDEALENIFKPISKPLKNVLNTTAAAAATTALVKKEIKTKPEVKKEETHFNTVDNDDRDFNKDESEEFEFEDSNDVFRSEDAALPHQDLNQYPRISQEYIENFWNKSKKIDLVYGPKYDSVVPRWYIGVKIIEFDRATGDVLVDGVTFKGTHGLYNLIFFKDPEPYTQSDLNEYKSLLDVSSAHRDTRNHLKRSNMRKYLQVIRPLYKNVSIGGDGLKMMYNNKNTEYVYWDDTNELVERLKLLVASQEAGNNSHQNEIVAIINELKEANIIRDK